jgi:hypothetical protein
VEGLSLVLTAFTIVDVASENPPGERCTSVKRTGFPEAAYCECVPVLCVACGEVDWLMLAGTVLSLLEIGSVIAPMTIK